MNNASTLHILVKASDALTQTLLRSFDKDDSLLLTGDGVYAALAKNSILPSRTQALRVDVEARGLLPQWPRHIVLTDHAGFVDLCVQHSRSLSWV